MPRTTRRSSITQINKAEFYQQNLPLAYRFAHTYAQIFSFSVEELETEAVSRLGIIVASFHLTYKPGKGTLPRTWLYHCLRTGMLDYCTRRSHNFRAIHPKTKHRLLSDIDPEKLGWYMRTSRPHFLEHLLQELGTEARILVSIIVKAPGELSRDLQPKTRGRGRKAIKLYLEKHHWSPRKIERTWSEVVECL